jgi:hypothetical protein
VRKLVIGANPDATGHRGRGRCGIHVICWDCTMNIDPQALYVQLGRLIETMPELMCFGME